MKAKVAYLSLDSALKDFKLVKAETAAFESNFSKAAVLAS